MKSHESLIATYIKKHAVYSCGYKFKRKTVKDFYDLYLKYRVIVS